LQEMPKAAQHHATQRNPKAAARASNTRSHFTNFTSRDSERRHTSDNSSATGYSFGSCPKLIRRSSTLPCFVGSRIRGKFCLRLFRQRTWFAPSEDERHHHRSLICSSRQHQGHGSTDRFLKNPRSISLLQRAHSIQGHWFTAKIIM
jgi:hypothetical protein